MKENVSSQRLVESTGASPGVLTLAAKMHQVTCSDSIPTNLAITDLRLKNGEQLRVTRNSDIMSTIMKSFYEPDDLHQDEYQSSGGTQ